MSKHIHLVGVSFGMAVLLMPTLAAAQNVTLNVLSPASVLAKGAGVDVSVHVACTNFSSPPTQASVGVCPLTERVGNKITGGCGFIGGPITCDGSLQTFDVIVTSGIKFAKGQAIAQASASVCDTLTCQFANQTKVIELVVPKKQ